LDSGRTDRAILIHLGIARYLPHLHPWLGAALAWVPAGLVFALGVTAGQVAVLTFAGVSLLLASLRGDRAFLRARPDHRKRQITGGASMCETIEGMP